MVVARSLSETRPYICKAERDQPPEKRTTFHLRFLPATLHLAIEQMHDANPGPDFAAGMKVPHISMRLGDRAKVTLLAGVGGWDNLCDEKGEPVKFKAAAGDRNICGLVVKNPADVDLIDRLPTAVAFELVEAISEGNTVTEGDAKN